MPGYIVVISFTINQVTAWKTLEWGEKKVLDNDCENVTFFTFIIRISTI